MTQSSQEFSGATWTSGLKHVIAAALTFFCVLPCLTFDGVWDGWGGVCVCMGVGGCVHMCVHLRGTYCWVCSVLGWTGHLMFQLAAGGWCHRLIWELSDAAWLLNVSRKKQNQLGAVMDRAHLWPLPSSHLCYHPPTPCLCVCVHLLICVCVCVWSVYAHVSQRPTHSIFAVIYVLWYLGSKPGRQHGKSHRMLRH